VERGQFCEQQPERTRGLGKTGEGGGGVPDGSSKGRKRGGRWRTHGLKEREHVRELKGRVVSKGAGKRRGEKRN